ncbi:MAG: hypothetical protein DWQ37_00805 [Planctomycetota bacterium]|nr:MAG: hypothetical protein DWQ37_00805 [Planctomycetota bacterium]
MKVIRTALVDWEPLTIRVTGENLHAANLERFTGQWLVARATAGYCGCVDKSLSVRPHEDRLVVACQWMCESCLADYLARLESQFPRILEVKIGLDKDKARDGKETPSPFVDVPEKTVELEDGQRVRVAAFRIARNAVSLSEFREFVEATGYETTAQQQRLSETFLNHPAMSPSTRERAASAVMCVSFYDATEYCAWRTGVRLPTEVEWVAASIVDQHIYDEWKDRELVNDAEGRLRQMSLPNALHSLGCEWTATELSDEIAIVRLGPQWVRFTGWEKKRNRRLTPKDESSPFVGFRVALK